MPQGELGRSHGRSPFCAAIVAGLFMSRTNRPPMSIAQLKKFMDKKEAGDKIAVVVGTVTDDVVGTLNEFRKGRVDFRQDKGAVIHAGLGKVNQDKSALVENVAAFFGAVMKARPKGVKGSGVQGYVKSVTLCTTMGKSVKVSIPDILSASVKARKKS